MEKLNTYISTQDTELLQSLEQNEEAIQSISNMYGTTPDVTREAIQAAIKERQV